MKRAATSLMGQQWTHVLRQLRYAAVQTVRLLGRGTINFPLGQSPSQPHGKWPASYTHSS